MVCRSRNMGLYCIDVSFLSGRRTRMARDKDGGETFKTTCKENSIRGWKTASKSLSNPPINLAPKESSALSCLSVCELLFFFSQPGKQTAQFVLSWSFVITLSIYSLFPLKVPQKSSQTRNQQPKACSLLGPLSSALGRGPNMRCCVETWLVYRCGNRSGNSFESWAARLAPGLQVALEGRQM